MCRIVSFGSIYSTICTLIILNSIALFAANKYILRCNNELLLKSESIMMLQVGKIEISENKGIAKLYLDAVGLTGAYPYCAAGQYYCFLQASKMLNLPENSIPIPRTGLSRKILAYATRYGKKTDFYPSQHDLIVWRVRESSWQGHIERIIKIEKAGWVCTVGFNVKIAQKIEGVAIKRRNIFHITGRMRVAGLIGFQGVRE
jgi:hypothetical protein